MDTAVKMVNNKAVLERAPTAFPLAAKRAKVTRAKDAPTREATFSIVI